MALTAIFVAFVQPLQARECVIADPTDTSLNVRATPNGTLVNSLRNGREVTITEIRNDAKGRPWGYAVGQYKGQFRNWGWVFMARVKCDRVDSTEKFWIQVASRETQNEAIELARGYAQRFESTSVFQSENQWYSVVIGTVANGKLQDTLRNLKASGAIPQDSYGTAGKSFGQNVWSAKAEMAAKTKAATPPNPPVGSGAAPKTISRPTTTAATANPEPQQSGLAGGSYIGEIEDGAVLCPAQEISQLPNYFFDNLPQYLKDMVLEDPTKQIKPASTDFLTQAGTSLWRFQQIGPVVFYKDGRALVIRTGSSSGLEQHYEGQWQLTQDKGITIDLKGLPSPSLGMHHYRCEGGTMLLNSAFNGNNQKKVKICEMVMMCKTWYASQPEKTTTPNATILGLIEWSPSRVEPPQLRWVGDDGNPNF